MRNFATTAVLKHPVETVWLALRDHINDFVPQVGDIRSVTTTSRVETPEVVLLVNVWEAEPQIPPAVAAVLSSKLFRWTDHARWVAANHECHWVIEPAFAPSRVSCDGTTSYEPAIGGRGTRITFRGTLDISVGGALGAPLTALVEGFVTTLIPRNFQNLAAAAGSYLGRRYG
ncbi:MAG TPA: DUF2505 family protein [Thermoanaerobaculia bacterium]|jgi:hypothetical protein